VKGFELEMGSFSLKELKEYKGKLGIGGQALRRCADGTWRTGR
jgi:hypothetical protein